MDMRADPAQEEFGVIASGGKPALAGCPERSNDGGIALFSLMALYGASLPRHQGNARLDATHRHT
jgi:hypothetical protein